MNPPTLWGGTDGATMQAAARRAKIMIEGSKETSKMECVGFGGLCVEQFPFSTISGVSRKESKKCRNSSAYCGLGPSTLNPVLGGLGMNCGTLRS